MHLCCFFLRKIVANYALLVCTIFGPKIQSCKFFDKSQVWRQQTKGVCSNYQEGHFSSGRNFSNCFLLNILFCFSWILPRISSIVVHSAFADAALCLFRRGPIFLFQNKTFLKGTCLIIIVI